MSLSELKHSYPITLPGFNFIRSRINREHTQRGGVGVLIKRYLWQYVHNILDDQVWFSINGIPECTFGCVYIPPRDSPYYSMQSSASIQEYCKNNNHIFVIGDLNARLGVLDSF